MPAVDSHTQVKICGLTTAQDVEFAIEAGVQMLGFNFVPASPRAISVDQMRDLVAVVRGRAEVVAVVADRTLTELEELRSATGVDTFQLHGAEPPEFFKSLAAHDYKAVRIGNRLDVALAQHFPGERLLVDAKVHGALGGTGHVFDWSLIVQLASERRLLLAGGLTPSNVATAITRVRPWAVDTASGVESRPGVKDPELVSRFVANVHTAL
jgi:phosphoribosylanthranilate isomerase